MEDKVRVLRLLEYVGDRKWVENTLQRGSVPCDSARIVSNGRMIKSCLIDKFPSVLSNDDIIKLEHTTKDLNTVLDLLQQCNTILDLNDKEDENLNLACKNIAFTIANVIKYQQGQGNYTNKNYNPHDVFGDNEI